MGRQDAIAARQQMLTGLAIAARGAGVALPGATPPAPPANPVRRERQAALGSALPFAAFGGPIDKIAALQPAVENATPLVSADPSQAAEMLNQVALTLDLVEQDQLAAIQAVSQSINGKADLLANTLQSLGHRVPLTNLGGPYVPIEGDANDFRDGVAAVSDEIELLAGLVDAARQLPLARPIEVTGMTSGFGRRLDPFLRRPAMHTGVDFGAASGTTVRATGPGRVIVAGRNGGYGKMVEIDHGNGLTTRYAHMSRISVKVGDVVDAGTMVGRVGSTGRSTGPHLHYEVRRSGRAIDPIPYLRAGDRIISLL
jgi:murein DD-endopeptidase MepM/ murein hydrolase activator NlpD